MVFALLGVSEARRLYGISEHTLYRLAAEGRLHPVKPNGRVLYPAWELDMVLRKPRNGGGPEYPGGDPNNPYWRWLRGQYGNEVGLVA